MVTNGNDLPQNRSFRNRSLTENLSRFLEIQPGYTVRKAASDELEATLRPMHNSALPACAILQKIRYTPG